MYKVLISFYSDLYGKSIRTLYQLYGCVKCAYTKSGDNKHFVFDLSNCTFCSLDLTLHISSVAELTVEINIENSTSYWLVYDTSDRTYKFRKYGRQYEFNNNTDYAILMIYTYQNIIVPMPGINVVCTEGAFLMQYNSSMPNRLNKYDFDTNSNQIDYDYGKVFTPVKHGTLQNTAASLKTTGYYTGVLGWESIANHNPVTNRLTWEFTIKDIGEYLFLNNSEYSAFIFMNNTTVTTTYSNAYRISINVTQPNTHICVVFNFGSINNIEDYKSAVTKSIANVRVVATNSLHKVDLTTNNLFNYKNIIGHKYIAANNGNIDDNEVLCYDDEYKPVRPGQKIYVNNYYHLISYYGLSKQYIGYWLRSDNKNDETAAPIYEYTIPDGVYWIRISAMMYEMDQLVVVFDTEKLKQRNRRIVNYSRYSAHHTGNARVFDTSATNTSNKYIMNAGQRILSNIKTLVTANNIKIGAEIKFLENSSYTLGFDGSNSGLYISDGAAVVNVNTSTKTISFQNGDGKNTTFTTLSSTTYSDTLNFDYHYLITIEKVSVCKYIIDFICVNTGESICHFEHNYTVNTSNPDSVTKQARGWGLVYSMCHSGSLEVYNLTADYTGPLNPRVAVFGDSYIENYGKNYLASWANRLYDKLDGNVFIAGYGGCSMPGLITRLPLEMQLCNPDYIVIATGVNDSFRSSLDNYYSGMEKILQWCKLKNVEPVLITCPVCISGTTENTLLSRQITDFVRNSGYKYIDYRKALCNYNSDDVADFTNKYLSDKVHPNIAGGAAIFSWIEANLPELLG